MGKKKRLIVIVPTTWSAGESASNTVKLIVGHDPSIQIYKHEKVQLEFDGIEQYEVNSIIQRIHAALPKAEMNTKDSYSPNYSSSNYTPPAPKPRLLITVTSGDRFLVNTYSEDMTKEIIWIRDYGFTPLGSSSHHSCSEIEKIEIKSPETTMADIEKDEKKNALVVVDAGTDN